MAENALFIIPGPVFGPWRKAQLDLMQGRKFALFIEGTPGGTVAAKSWGYAESRCLHWCQSAWLATYTSSKSGVLVWLWKCNLPPILEPMGMIKWASRVNGGKIQGSRVRWLVTLGWETQYKYRYMYRCWCNVQCTHNVTLGPSDWDNIFNVVIWYRESFISLENVLSVAIVI